MKYVPKSKMKKYQNSDTTEALEYNLGDPDIDISPVRINGNYPDKGFVVNEEAKELLYVLSGEGTLHTKNNFVLLRSGDQALIDKGELFRYENCDNLRLIAACTPAWSPAQHKEVSE